MSPLLAPHPSSHWAAKPIKVIPMRSVRLPIGGISASRIGFGTSRLHHVAARERQALVAAAVERGITYFDTAPCYGDGLAERELGRFLQAAKGRIVVATKYGLPADPVISRAGRLAGPFRVARAFARRTGFWPEKRPPLDAAGLRASVRSSLGRMGADVVDVLLLHDPTFARIPSFDDLLEEMQRLRQAGTVRAFGLAGHWSDIVALSKRAAGFPLLLQTADTEWEGANPPDITYSAIASTRQSAFAPRIDGKSALERLQVALRRRQNGVVLVSTTRPEHLDALSASERFV
jgi:aryl-alcohol dehydrogenase-like predicted oxidoreductase